ncbi:MAG TPA: T9SS type A sorting domain-containing protein [Bacteroidia bacterium]|nr:T9SS type A sorting domain-containing protein [Bacteroidia bacterium]
MKKYLLFINSLFCMLLLVCQDAHSQNPLVKQWDKRLGGTFHDPVYSFQQTTDGGYILGGESYSDSSGDKTEDNWDPTLQSADYWIVKIDSAGMKQWDKRFGGTGDDYLLEVKQTSDGGYILGGASDSDSSGDKTQNAWGQYDYWIVKTDSLGIKQWDKRFGGIANEELYSLKQTTDGGYILGGYSYSDISGDKTQPSQGQDDYWMVKTDAFGIKQWDKRFGGAGYDEAYTIEQTTDSGYIMGGYTTMGSSGDVTQPIWGGWDYWIVKTNVSGIKLWDKRFGGTNDDVLYSIHQTLDGGYILNGCSKSDSSGDKTQNNWDVTAATYDLWVIKIDALGSKEWDKGFGGDNDENIAGNVSQTSDNGFLIPGTSYSGINGTKTENNLGVEQAWITKTDSLGNQQWDKTAFTDGHDEAGLSVQTIDGCYAIVTGTASGIAGYKTEPNWDVSGITYDYWIVKFCDSISTIGINGFEVSGLKFDVYPNPANEFVVISYHLSGKEKIEITITDITGKKLLHSTFNIQHSTFKIDVSNLSSGIYFIKAGTAVKKLVKN